MVALTDEELKQLCFEPEPETKEFIFQQTMYRIKDPRKSLPFYTKVMGMRLLKKFDFPEMKFSLYYIGYQDIKDFPEDEMERNVWAVSQKATLELTHNWGTENDENFKYHNGNTEPRGYGHIGLWVPDVHEACKRFQEMGVDFEKTPDGGRMKGIAFIKDPDGYWIEILNLGNVLRNPDRYR